MTRPAAAMYYCEQLTTVACVCRPDLWTPNVTDTAFLQSWLQVRPLCALSMR